MLLSRRPQVFFGRRKGWKWNWIPSRPLDTSLSGSRASHIFCRLEGRDLGPRTRWPVEKSFLDLAKVAFLAGQEEENILVRPCGPLKYRILGLVHVAFRTGQKAENDFEGTATPWNIAFSTSQKSFLCSPEGRKWVRRSRCPIQTLISRCRKVAWWAGQKAENEFAGTGDKLKHHFLVFVTSYFDSARRHKKI
jgi:hypothetical protein